ncbi:hypothetical protein V498_08531 [Pseudogymnoascus sp. VKM F-4517 (FW-2822)]|nr:hypothetical protein V498_08531 [Pseudogymnoascus sp. VKM F-4517 (FW-2822)]
MPPTPTPTPAAGKRQRLSPAATARSASAGSSTSSATSAPTRKRSPSNASAARRLDDATSWHHVATAAARANAAKAQSRPQITAAIPNLIDPDLLAQQPSYPPIQDLRARPPQEAPIPQQQQQQQQPPPPPQRLPCSLDLLSDAATHIASSNNHTNQLPPIHSLHQDSSAEPESKRARTTSFNSRAGPDEGGARRGSYHHHHATLSEAPQPQPLLGDYNIFLDDFGISSHVFPPIDAEGAAGTTWARPMTHEGYADPSRQSYDSRVGGPPEQGQNNRFDSRFSSIASDRGGRGPALESKQPRAPAHAEQARRLRGRAAGRLRVPVAVHAVAVPGGVLQRVPRARAVPARADAVGGGAGAGAAADARGDRGAVSVRGAAREWAVCDGRGDSPTPTPPASKQFKPSSSSSQSAPGPPASSSANPSPCAAGSPSSCKNPPSPTRRPRTPP